MHCRLDAIPEQADFGGMAIACTRLPGGFDLSPMLAGLPDDLCPCPHWGYVLEGRLRVKYADGSEEEVAAGDVYYLAAGHTAVVQEDAVTLDFSPIEPFRRLMQHLAAKMQQA